MHVCRHGIDQLIEDVGVDIQALMCVCSYDKHITHNLYFSTSVAGVLKRIHCDHCVVGRMISNETVT